MLRGGNKKGLSTIVATLIIILLVLVAAGILWAVIRGIISENAERISFGKLTINLEIVSVKQNPTDLNVKVKRNVGEGDLKGISFIIFDGEETHVFEKTNITLREFEIKTFVIPYTGKVVSVSIAPIFLTSSGKFITESIADRYYFAGTTEGGGSSLPVCTSNCDGIECGDDGCGGKCGTCGDGEQCVQGECTTSTIPCVPNCNCAATTCVGRTCSDGCEGSCEGLLSPNCNLVMCGPAPNGCGSCSECDLGSHCDGGVCVRDCLISDCGTRKCGSLPDRPDCGETFCGICTGTGETCNEITGVCEVCEPDCSGRDCGLDPVCQSSCGECTGTDICNITLGECIQCTPDCGTRECGPVPNKCGENCGVCDTASGEYCTIDGKCTKDVALNTGTVFSVWPWPLGRLYFDSADLPKTGSYVGYYAKVESEEDCLTISEYHIPYFPEVYDKSYMKVSATATIIEPGDSYEIWEKYSSCAASSWT